ncbi:MAG: gluconate 2-dehydrogenase subunit 3 family protein [Acidobacteriota bacterium]
MTGINRRQAVRAMAATASALWAGRLTAFARDQADHAHMVAASEASAFVPKVLSAHQFETVGVLADLILPATETPGAKALQVDRYIDVVLRTAPDADRRRFISGLTWLDTRSRALFGRSFVASAPEQQTEFLTRLSDGRVSAPEAPAGIAFFEAIKGMTIAGYYTTEVGLRQELGDDGRMVLSRFEGCTHPEHQ